MLNSEYHKLVENVQQQLSKTEAVCLTSDGWTDRNNASFMAATAFIIDEDESKLKCYLLDCSEFTKRHTAGNIVG